MKFCFYEVRDDEMATLNALSEKYDVELIHTGDVLNDETIKLAEGCDGISTLGHSNISHDILKKMADMGIFAYSARCIGFNHIDLDAAKEFGVKIANASYAPNGVADYTVMMMLMLLRKYKPALWRQQVNDYSLGGLMGRQLGSLTVGVIGTGRIGTAVIKNLTGFGCKILCNDLYENPETAKLAEYTDLDTIYHNADIITLHTPLQDSTWHMINERTLGKMKKDAILINCARAELVDIDAVTKAIEEEKIGGVGLDVFEKEGSIYHRDRRTDILKNRSMAYLRQFPNVIMTQHVAFYTEEAVVSMATCGMESLVAFVNGETHPNQLA